MEFAPDRPRLVFLVRGAAGAIGTLDLRTDRRRRIPSATIGGLPLDVNWTPNGRRIAYLHHQWTRQGGIVPLTPTTLRTIRPDGTHMRQLATLPPDWGLPDDLTWRADD